MSLGVKSSNERETLTAVTRRRSWCIAKRQENPHSLLCTETTTRFDHSVTRHITQFNGGVIWIEPMASSTGGTAASQAHQPRGP